MQDGGIIKRQKDINHQRTKPIPLICHLPDLPTLSLVTTFKSHNYATGIIFLNSCNLIPDIEGKTGQYDTSINLYQASFIRFLM
jgi:hypothetical protein